MSNIIDSIQVSGTVYQIQGSGGGNNVIELTQAQYDALVDKDPTALYIITDAEAVDLANYYTKSETSGATQISTALNAKADTATTYTKTEVDTALGGKQATLVSGTNIKTINNQSILGSGNIDIQGGGSDINVVQTTGTSTTDVMSQDAVTTAINTVSGAIPSTYVSTITIDNDEGYQRFYRFSTPSNFNYFTLNNAKINNRAILSTSWGGFNTNFSLVETSAITTSMSSASTDSQVPSAKAVYDQLGGLKLVKLTQAEYDALATKDTNTLYVIV